LITKIFGKLIPAKIKKELINFRILASEYGQYKTIKTWDCVDKHQNKIPWYTYPAIEYLNNLDFSNKVIFEYGSGNSSSYWSKKSKLVISVEHDKEWYKKVKSTLNNNQQLLLSKDNTEYENSILNKSQKFDVIIIDGIRRPECSKVIVSALNKDSEEGFMVILDNSDWYQETSKFLREELNLIEVDFHGFGPINNYTWTTSIFLSRNFKFNPINNIQPNFSIAAIHQSGEY
jgi:hypothetical protein